MDDSVNYGEMAERLRELRRNEAVKLAKEGMSLRRIAVRLGISHTMVQADLRSKGMAATAVDDDAGNDPLDVAGDDPPASTPGADGYDSKTFLEAVPRG